MADLISLGVVSAVAGCSSPVVYIPLRGGRVDATEGGPYGVPEPETSVEETLSELLTAGFNHSEAIVSGPSKSDSNLIHLHYYRH